jgi:S1-C subfamily serine protease
MAVQDLTPDLRDQLRLKEGEGIVVSGVEEAGPAARAGIRPGDVIAEANREPVRTVSDFARILTRLRPRENLLLLVRRDGSSRFAVLSPKN